jgi:putative photosynthetic complex assembly protein
MAAMTARLRRQLFPRGALIGAAALVALAVVSAAAARMTGIGTTKMPDVGAVESRDLRFDDRADGAVVIHDVCDDSIVEILSPGTNGFLRGVLRGLVRERKRQGIGPDLPFRLTRWTDGRLSIEDVATRQQIDFGAFGPTNSAVFARLIQERSSPR